MTWLDKLCIANELFENYGEYLFSEDVEDLSNNEREILSYIEPNEDGEYSIEDLICIICNEGGAQILAFDISQMFDSCGCDVYSMSYVVTLNGEVFSFLNIPYQRN
jgi:hypothetical protein